MELNQTGWVFFCIEGGFFRNTFFLFLCTVLLLWLTMVRSRDASYYHPLPLCVCVQGLSRLSRAVFCVCVQGLSRLSTACSASRCGCAPSCSCRCLSSWGWWTSASPSSTSLAGPSRPSQGPWDSTSGTDLLVSQHFTSLHDELFHFQSHHCFINNSVDNYSIYNH